jgi:hypothetical protein
MEIPMTTNPSTHVFPDYDCITEREVKLMIQSGLVTEIAEDDNGEWLQKIEDEFNNCTQNNLLDVAPIS